MEPQGSTPIQGDGEQSQDSNLNNNPAQAPLNNQPQQQQPSNQPFDASTLFKEKIDDSADEEIEGIEQDDKENIEKVINPRLSRFESQQAEAMAKIDVNTFLSNPENAPFKKFEAQVVDVLKDPSNRFKAEAIFYAIAGMSGEFKTIIAKQIQDANNNAAITATGGEPPARTGEPPKLDFQNMSKEEYQKVRDRVISGEIKLS